MQAMPASAPSLSLPSTSVLKHGWVVVSVCLLITVLLTWLGQGSWDVNLVCSLAIGLPTWLTIEIGRRRFSDSADIPWPKGWRGVLLVVCGVLIGFSLGSLIGHSYQRWMYPQQSNAQTPELLFPMLITIACSAGMSTFFFLLGKARYLQMQAEQSQRQAAEAHLQLLQAQLEPHMLFNTLANLRVLISVDTARAEQMLDHLIDYLRATLSGSRSGTHSLSAEFALLADYLALMQIRMAERLRYTLELPAELADVPVPPLLLQPLVENSIRHGLEPQLAGGHIHVQAALLNGDRVCLTVLDNGAGLPQPLQEAEADPRKGFGLQQIRERLANRYGDAATFNLIADSANGTKASIIFPLKSVS
ncbi:sensor histidine kinase [Comamonas testosteroni]|uniref:Sensor histidine kinase n=1 Tax=Comamonas testosteroni TaxID=285 RepID=A0A373FPL1_COMTE|nr:sensor histidine kinase [Comamonas testosteroni]